MKPSNSKIYEQLLNDVKKKLYHFLRKHPESKYQQSIAQLLEDRQNQIANHGRFHLEQILEPLYSYKEPDLALIQLLRKLSHFFIKKNSKGETILDKIIIKEPQSLSLLAAGLKYLPYEDRLSIFGSHPIIKATRYQPKAIRPLLYLTDGFSSFDLKCLFCKDAEDTLFIKWAYENLKEAFTSEANALLEIFKQLDKKDRYEILSQRQKAYPNQTVLSKAIIRRNPTLSMLILKSLEDFKPEDIFAILHQKSKFSSCNHLAMAITELNLDCNLQIIKLMKKLTAEKATTLLSNRSRFAGFSPLMLATIYKIDMLRPLLELIKTLPTHNQKFIFLQKDNYNRNALDIAKDSDRFTILKYYYNELEHLDDAKVNPNSNNYLRY
jgi:hypothetical protein